MRRTVVTRVLDAVKAIAICHNVTPVHENDPNAKVKRRLVNLICIEVLS